MRKVITLSFFLLTLPALTFGQSVDILWQGEGYNSPFYEGRTLWSSQSSITLLAIPQGLGSPSALNYKWSRNGTVLGNTNGIGKNSISLLDSILSKSQTIKIEIVAADGSTSAQSSVVITPRSPVLLVYEQNPLYGFMFHREVGSNYKLTEPEVTFAAFPLFFSIFNRVEGTVVYKWGTNAGGSGTGASAVYRAPEGGSGEAVVSISLENKEEILQTANKNFLVEFGEE